MIRNLLYFIVIVMLVSSCEDTHAYKDERKSGILDLLLDKGDYYLVIWFDESCALFNCGDTKINAEFFYEGLFG
ncbi:MAG TPA: hypothetical protein EYN67_17385 [Flavobacteriales bacterium]|nr:hypothetical protein [Flavobacteriales bacterium]